MSQAERNPLQFITPICRLSYPKLATPHKSPLYSAEKKAKNTRAYEAVGVFEGKVPPLLLQKVELAIATKWPNRPAKIELPWRNNHDRINDAGEIVKGYEVPGFYLSFREEGNDERPPVPPALFGPTREIPGDPKSPFVRLPASAFYAGCYVVFQARAYAYEFEKVKRGVAFGLVAVQFVRDGERLGRGASVDESAFTEHMSEAELEGDTSLGDFVPF